MRFAGSTCLVGALGVLLGGGAWAQSVISAHSGLVQYVMGRVTLDGKELDPKFGEFPTIKNNQVLKTEQGMAEVLLSPGTFLRLGENSAVRMVSNRLTDTRLEVLSGKALVECADVNKDDALTVQIAGDSVQPLKSGLYEFIAAAPPSLKVYQGEASVQAPNGTVTVKKGREAMLSAAVEEHKFDTSETDDLYNWTSRRSGYLAAANVSSAKTMSSGYGYSGNGSLYSLYGGYGAFGGYPGFGYGYPFGYGMMGMGFGLYNGWAWNPVFGMFTYVPYDGMYMSPFGYAFWSPYTVGYALPMFYGGGATNGRAFGGRGVASSFAAARNGRTASTPYNSARVAAISHIAAGTARSSVSSGSWHGGAASSGGGWAGRASSGMSSVSSVSSMGSVGHAGGSHR